MKRIPAVLLALILVFLCLFSAAAESETDLKSGDYSYRLLPDGTAMITRYKGDGEDLFIPSELDGIPVTAIGAEAFKSRNTLMYVSLPDSITEIGDSAFMTCGNLMLINIPDAVKRIGRNPFAGCSSLSDIDISKDHPLLSLQDGVLFSKPDQRLIYYSMQLQGAYEVPDGTRIIGASAFYTCDGLSELTLPETVTSIGRKAFYQCNRLKSINLPDSISYLGDGAFNGCSNLTSLRCPDTITEIGVSAFEGCRNLSELILPEDATTIGDRAFFDCSGLTSIELPEGISSIGQNTGGCDLHRRRRLPGLH